MSVGFVYLLYDWCKRIANAGGPDIETMNTILILTSHPFSVVIADLQSEVVLARMGP